MMKADRPLRWPPIETLKTYIEIAAFGLAAIFLLGKVISGQYNDGMEVKLTAERCRVSDKSEDIIALGIQLKRNDIGRIEILDILVERWEDSPTSGTPYPHREMMRIRERSRKADALSRKPAHDNTFLPPGDATQLGYMIPAPHGSPVTLDVTILARRTRLRFGYPQWRASTVVLPTGRKCVEYKSDS